MPIPTPLDKIPQIPVQIINSLIPLGEQLIQQLTELLLSAIEDAIQLPDRIDCNDPRVQAILDRLNQAQELLGRLAQIIGFIATFLPILKTLITVGSSIRVAIMLGAGPFGAIIAAASLDAIVQLTISNATEAIKGLGSWADRFEDLGEQVGGIALASLYDKLSEVASQLAPICGDDVLNGDGNGSLNSGIGSSSNRIGDSELQKTLDDANNLLVNAVSQYSGLLTSIEEAPSKVYEGVSAPVSTIGKPGDYFIDRNAKLIYGPKPIRTDWGDGVNY